MTLPRKQLIPIEATPYYHIITRCVRWKYIIQRRVTYKENKSSWKFIFYA